MLVLFSRSCETCSKGGVPLLRRLHAAACWLLY